MITNIFFYYIFIVLALLVDLIACCLFSFHALYLTRILYYLEIFKATSLWRLIPIGFLVLVESFIFNGCCAIDLIVMVPLTLAAYKIRKAVHLHSFVYALLVMICLLVHYMVLDYGLFGRSLQFVFNLKSFSIHFIIILILINYIFGGSQGNRSRYLS